jgi:hypothetical protein
VTNNPYQSPTVPDPQKSPVATKPDGKHCPACGEDIGIWPIVSAIVPGRSKCPHCQTGLTWKGAYVATGVMVLLTLAITGTAMLVVHRLAIEDRWVSGVAFLGMALPPVFVISGIGAALQRRYCVLRKR